MFKITNHLLVLLKYIYIKIGILGSVDMSRLINETRKIKTLEKNIATNGTKKQVICNKKWEKTHKAIKI